MYTFIVTLLAIAFIIGIIAVGVDIVKGIWNGIKWIVNIIRGKK